MKACAENQEIFNFFRLYWCDFDGKMWALIITAVVLIAVIFKYTSIIVEEYISEGIQNVAKWLKLSDSLAGVTLLAFANGAGDVITALVASEAEGGVSYNIGSLYGAGLFSCTIVLAICIFQSKSQMVFDKMIVFRDIGFCLGSIAIMACLALYKWITWWGSIALLLWYVLLVVVVFIQESKEEQEIDMGDEKGPKEDDPVDDLNRYFAQGMVTIGKFVSDKASPLETFWYRMKLRFYSGKLKLKFEYLRRTRNKPESQMTSWEHFVNFVEAPFKMILFLTVLPCDEEQYSKKRCIAYPVPGLLFAVWVIFKEFTYWRVLIALTAALIMIIVFFSTLEEEKPPSYFIFINIQGVVGGLMWTTILVGILIDLLGCIGILLNIDQIYLGLTVLAIGNALSDALTTIALCKQGAGTMAISGVYAGQLFALLIGFGLSMLKLTLKHGPQPFDLLDPTKIQDNIMPLIVIGGSAIALVCTFIYAVSNGFIMDKKIAVLLLLIYIFVIASATIVTAKRAMEPREAI